MVDSWSILPRPDRRPPAFLPPEAGFSIHSCWRSQLWRVILQRGLVPTTAGSKIRRPGPPGPGLSRDPCSSRFASHDCLARRGGKRGGSRFWPRIERSRDRSAISGSSREKILPGQPSLARIPSSRCPDEPALARQAAPGVRLAPPLPGRLRDGSAHAADESRVATSPVVSPAVSSSTSVSVSVSVSSTPESPGCERVGGLRRARMPGNISAALSWSCRR